MVNRMINVKARFVHFLVTMKEMAAVDFGFPPASEIESTTLADPNESSYVIRNYLTSPTSYVPWPKARISAVSTLRLVSRLLCSTGVAGYLMC